MPIILDDSGGRCQSKTEGENKRPNRQSNAAQFVG